MLTFFERFRKHQAIRTYLRPLRRALVKRYGKRPHYTPRQVRSTIVSVGLSLTYDCYAYAIYCSPEEFQQYHEEAGENCSYGEMRAEVAHLYDHTGSISVDSGDSAESADSIDFNDAFFAEVDGGHWGADGFGGDAGGDGGSGGDGGGGGGGE